MPLLSRSPAAARGVRVQLCSTTDNERTACPLLPGTEQLAPRQCPLAALLPLVHPLRSVRARVTSSPAPPSCGSSRLSKSNPTCKLPQRKTKQTGGAGELTRECQFGRAQGESGGRDVCGGATGRCAEPDGDHDGDQDNARWRDDGDDHLPAVFDRNGHTHRGTRAADVLGHASVRLSVAADRAAADVSAPRHAPSRCGRVRVVRRVELRNSVRRQHAPAARAACAEAPPRFGLSSRRVGHPGLRAALLRCRASTAFAALEHLPYHGRRVAPRNTPGSAS